MAAIEVTQSLYVTLMEANPSFFPGFSRPVETVTWFDAVALRRSIINSSVSGLCVTKLDVLDELETIQICVGYEIDGEPVSGVPVVVDRFAACKPVYEEWPGWQSETVGAKNLDELPEKAKSYLQRIEELAGVPVDIISTGPDREQTIIIRDPFA